MKKSIHFLSVMLLGLILFYSSCGVPDGQREQEKRDSIKNLRIADSLENLRDCTKVMKSLGSVPDDQVDLRKKDSVRISGPK